MSDSTPPMDPAGQAPASPPPSGRYAPENPPQAPGQSLPQGYGQDPPHTQGQYPPPGYGQYPAPGYGQYPAPGYGPPPPAPAGTGIPAWAIVLIIVGVLVLVAPIGAAVMIPVFLNQHAKADDSAIKEGGHAIQVGIQSYAVDHRDLYPGADDVAPAGAVDPYVDPWPVDPLTDAPMSQGTGSGDFAYEVAPDGGDYRLIVFLTNGEALLLKDWSTY